MLIRTCLLGRESVYVIAKMFNSIRDECTPNYFYDATNVNMNNSLLLIRIF